MALTSINELRRLFLESKTGKSIPFDIDIETAENEWLVGVVGENAFDISTSNLEDSKDVSAQETLMKDVFFKPSGDIMYVLGSGNDTIYQYNLGTNFDATTAVYDKSFSVTLQETTPRGLFLADEGEKLYVIGSINDSIYQYTLSTPWDITSAVYDSKSLDISSLETIPQSLFVNSTGEKLFFIGSSADIIFQYTMSINFDISTATYDNKSLDISTEDSSPRGLFISPLGDKIFMVGELTKSVHQYTMSINFDISTGTYDNLSLDVSALDDVPRGMYISNTGNDIFIVGSDTSNILSFNTLNGFTEFSVNSTKSDLLRALFLTEGALRWDDFLRNLGYVGSMERMKRQYYIDNT